MIRIRKLLVSLAVTAAFAGSAQAAQVDLGTAGTFNLYSLGNFSSASDTEGAVAVAGSLTASNYSINQNNMDGVSNPGYALAVGGSVSYTGGSIKNGLYYIGGATTLTNVGLDNATSTNVLPFSFSTVSSGLISLSGSLSTLAASGANAVAFGGMTLTGSGAATTVFNILGSDLSSVNNFTFAGLASGSTIILNVSGSSVTLQGGYDGFQNYNVLFNFYQATSLTFSNAGIYGSVLAPLATVSNGGGQINGNVIVGNWNSNVQVNDNHYFAATNVPGLVSAVPEPETYAMLVTGLGMLAWLTRRKNPLMSRIG